MHHSNIELPGVGAIGINADTSKINVSGQGNCNYSGTPFFIFTLLAIAN